MVNEMYSGLANKALQSKEQEKRHNSKLEYEREILASDEGNLVTRCFNVRNNIF